jgi:hypothetical protein
VAFSDRWSSGFGNSKIKVLASPFRKMLFGDVKAEKVLDDVMIER